MIDLTWITPDLSIGGSFAAEHAELLAREHRIGAIVDLRAEACDDAALLATHGIELLYLPTIDHAASSATQLARGVAFVDAHLAAERRVFVHCACGIGRSALLGLCVLVARGQEPLAALRLAKHQRACVSPSAAQFLAWATWLARFKSERGTDWGVPSFDDFAAIAYR